MLKHIYDEAGEKVLRTEVAEPTCGDLCDACGDCLYCYGEDPCVEKGTHFWVQYGDSPSAAHDAKESK